MADVTYSVEVQFLQQGNFQAPAQGLTQLTVKAEKLKKTTDHWGKSLFGSAATFTSAMGSAIDTIGGAMFNLASSAAVGIGTALSGGIAAATIAAFHFNEEMENTKYSLAAISNANGLTASFASGIDEAGMVISRMRVDAANLPGEFKDLQNILATIAAPGAQHGIDLFGMEKMAAQVMTTAAILRVPMDVAAREMAMLMSGTASHRMPLFNRLGFGMDAKEFNALDPKKRMALIQSQLDKMNPAVEKIKGTWTSIKTNALDNLRQGVGFLGQPLFESVKASVQAFNDWASNNRMQNRAFGEQLAEHIDKAFHRGRQAVMHWFPIVKQFAETMGTGLYNAWMGVSPIVHTMLDRLERFMKDPKAFDKLVHAAQMLIALRVGTGVASMGFSAAKAGAGILNASEAAAGAAGVAALGTGALVAGVAVAALALGAYGAAGAMTDSSSMFYDASLSAAADIVALTTKTTTAFDRFLTAIKPLTDAFGFAFLIVVEGAIGQISLFTDFLATAAENTRKFAQALERYAILLGYLDGPIGGKPKDALKNHVDEFYPERFHDPDKSGRNKVPNHTTHVHHVEIKVNSNQDPNRIAKKTVDLIGDLARHPKVAQGTGNPVFSR